MEEIIIRHTEISRYMQLKSQGYRVAWVGNGLICFVKPTGEKEKNGPTGK